MATEISSDLINHLKVSLRREANLSSFNPIAGDSSFHSFPTSTEAISELDPSAPYLRCRNCKGKLLRGIESLICVFCGENQRTRDNPPVPIKFTSTSGYKLFLTSLKLDGSEIVEPLKETNGLSRGGGKAPVVNGIALSKFLDLEIQWSAREEESVNIGLGKNPLNLGGISVDDYSVEEKGDLPQVDPAENKPEEDDFKDPRSLSLFDSVRSQGVVESQQSEKFGLFDGKETLKNVTSEKHENLSLFAGRDAQDSVSLSEHGNFGFFEEKDAQHSVEKDENLSLFESKDAPEASSSKTNESFGFSEGKDAQRNSSSREDINLGLFEAKDGQRNISSNEDGNFGLFEGVPSSNAGLKSFDDKVVASSSDWDSDFQSVSQEKTSHDPFVNSPHDFGAHMDSVFGFGNDKPADSSTPHIAEASDWLDDDLFGNVSGSKTPINVHDKNVVGGNGSSSMDIDWIGDDLWQTSEKKSIEKTHMDDTDDGDDWNDFASSANSKTPNDPLSQTMESPQEETSDRAKGQEDDIFGTWDSFTSSSVLQTPVQPPMNQVNPSAEQNPEMNLFGANKNHKDLDSYDVEEQTNSEEVNAMPSVTSSTSKRNSGLDGKDQTLDDLVGATTVTPKSKSDAAEDLMSQMHDLSFMLETKLSLPSNSKTE
ncbi:unnamed protein product [Cochlearia groenlandica]